MSKWRDKIAVNPACELIPPMSAEELATTGKDIKANGLLHPIVFWRDEETKKESLLDGRSRLDAYEAERLPIFAADLPIFTPDGALVVPYVIRTLNPKGPHDVKRPESETPESYVWSANVHRRHMSAEGKRKAIAALLKVDPSKSDRQVAKETGSSPQTVGRERHKSNVPMEHKPRIEASGRKARGRKPGKLPAPSPRMQAAPTGKPDCPDCKGEGTLTGTFGSDTKPTTVSCSCTKESAAPTTAPEPEQPPKVQTTLGPRFGATDGTTAAELDRRNAGRPLTRINALTAPAEPTPEETAEVRKAVHAASEATTPEPRLMSEWLVAADEQKSEFVNSVGLVKLYELASEAQRKQLEAHFPTARWKKDKGLEGVKTTIAHEAGEAAKALPAPATARLCAQCNDGSGMLDFVDGRWLHKECVEHWHRSHGGVRYSNGEAA
jgi:hypothetical protein